MIDTIPLFGSRTLVRVAETALWTLHTAAAKPVPLTKQESMFVNAALRAGSAIAIQHGAGGSTAFGITQERIAQLTLSAWADCGTQVAIEIAAREAYAAGMRAKRSNA